MPSVAKQQATMFEAMGLPSDGPRPCLMTWDAIFTGTEIHPPEPVWPEPDTAMEGAAT